MHLWEYLILLLAVLIGGLLAERSASGPWRSYVPYILSFSGAYLLGITALELIPAVFAEQFRGLGTWLLAGFLVQLLLEGFSQGVEHGHVHVHEGNFRYGIQVMIGLGIHALLEGIPLGADYHAGHDHGNHLLWGIVLHKLPAAFALGILLRASGYGRIWVWVALLIFGCLSPLGAVIGESISIDPVWRARILALVVGSFLHISTTILFEADGQRSHGISWRKLLVVVAGMALALGAAH